MPAEIQLGTLERVTIRDVWQNEAHNFTPWLAQPNNLALLGKTIGIDIELVEVEVPVGDYRLDILAQHSGTQESVVIENQFGRTDHSHLGQLLTYAAGVSADACGARTIIWIAERLCEPHRSALDWLNKITEPGIGFFGVEIELWRIGSSAPAPKFNLVSKPNQWQKVLSQHTSSAQAGDDLYSEFWSSFIERAQQGSTKLLFPNPWGRHWLPITIGRVNFIISLVVTKRDGFVRTELYMSGPKAKVAFRLLKREQATITAALGSDVSFDELPTRMASRISQQRAGDVKDKKTWPELQDWLLARAEAYAAFFTPRVKALDLDTVEEGDMNDAGNTEA